MTQYLYPQNLEARATMWLCGLHEFAILGVSAMLSAVILAYAGLVLPAAATLCCGFLTIRTDDMTILDYIRLAVRYFISTQQYYEWEEKTEL